MAAEQARILIVDDEPAIRKGLGKLFQRAGYARLEFAVDGKEALAKILHFEPDLLLLDVMMPPPDGLEVCRRLRHEQAYAHLRATPVIFLSARGMDREVAAGFDAGAWSYVVKPFLADDLLELVAFMLRGDPPG